MKIILIIYLSLILLHIYFDIMLLRLNSWIRSNDELLSFVAFYLILKSDLSRVNVGYFDIN